MKPQFTAEEAVAIIKAARGKNCKQKRLARKKKLRAVAKMAQFCGRAKTPMEKKAAPIGLLLTLASFAPEILKGLKWAGRGIGMLGKAAPLAKGVKGLTGAQRVGGALYRGLGHAGKFLGSHMATAGGAGKLGQGVRGLGAKITPWAEKLLRGGQYAGKLAANPGMAHGRRLSQALNLPKHMQLTGQLARGGPLALMGLGGLMGTGGDDQMQGSPQMAGGGYNPMMMAQLMGQPRGMGY